MAVCNNTQECVNQIGGFLCRCPAGSELNQQGLCIAIPLPVSTTAVLPSSTAVMMITTTTSIPVVTSTTSTVTVTPTPPAASEVIITLSGYTEQTVSDAIITTCTLIYELLNLITLHPFSDLKCKYFTVNYEDSSQ